MACRNEYEYNAFRWNGCDNCPRFMDDCDGDEEYHSQDLINCEVWKDETRS